MDIQRVRNLTTGRLHTKIGHVYQDIEYLTGESGIFTHMLPNACRALEPYMRESLPDPVFWNGAYDVSHIGSVDLKPLNEEQKAAFWKLYKSLPNPLFD